MQSLEKSGTPYLAIASIIRASPTILIKSLGRFYIYLGSTIIKQGLSYDKAK